MHGWGRIQTVERLAHTQDPRIRGWLLREGFRNSVMNEYLACICARAGRLHEALASSQVDPELLDGAAEIFRALLTGGPAEGIDDYGHAAEAAEAYVHHVWSGRWLELKHFLAVASLARYVDDPERQQNRRKEGWTEQRLVQIHATCNDILAWKLGARACSRAWPRAMS